jgi:hypothetical protein
MTGDRKGSKGRYMTGKQVDNYLNWQAEVKWLREENQRLLDYLVQVADEYTDADGITYEIYCKFGGEEE